jgi:hypothetical protein
MIASSSDHLESNAKFDMKARIESALGVLIGRRLESSGRAGDLQWFSFGILSEVSKGSGTGTREIGEYSLHVQCQWRILSPTGIVVGADDIYFPRGADPYSEPPDFDYQVTGSNRRDEKITAFNDLLRQLSILVRQILADHLGSLRLTMSEHYTLEIFPSNTLKDEYWRFFIPGASAEVPHFVVTGLGIED